MAAHSTSIFSPGLVLQSRYRLDEPVAAGGMAEVWRGHDMILKRQVAIKLLHPHLASDPSVAERFKREAVSAARLSHPHIVPTFDAGTSDDVSYIVLGLIDGPTLAEVMKSRTLGLEQATEIARQVADALDHAHRNGLVHRDVKPSNILLVDGGSRVMVADFGIAKAVADTASESLTLPGLVVGTPGYVAPEQLLGLGSDNRSDIFALGVMLHEMVCGHTDVDQPTELTVINDPGLNSGHPTCPNISPVLSLIVAKATAQDLNERYATAGEMRDDLARTQSRPTTPSPQREAGPGPAQRVEKAVETSRPRLPSQIKARPRPNYVSTSEQPVLGPITKWNPEPVRKSARRRQLVTTLIVLSLVAAAIALGVGIKEMGHGDGTHTVTAPTTVPAVSPAGASSFDPFGSDHVENESQTANAIDGDPSTSWSTETYSNSHFGNLKPGVGLIIHVNEGPKINQLEIDSPSSGWAASIYVSNGAPTALTGWGNEKAGQANIAAGTTTFPLNQSAGDSILIWITNLGTTDKVTINDVRVK